MTSGSKVTFQQLIDRGLLEVGDGYRAKLSELGRGGPIFLRAGHLSATGINLEGVERFKGELTQRLASKLSRPGDTVVTTKGNSIGRTAYVTADLPSFVYSPHLSYWRSLDHEELVPGFLRYWACGQEFIAQLEGMEFSTDMAPYLSLRDQRRLKMSLPSTKEQRGIAGVLSALDTKIELNRRLNQTLEAMARAIFTSWFVDFDPVVARAAGRVPPALNAETAALFPDHFMDCEVGPIPAGWRFSSIGAEVSVVGGSTPSTTEARFWEGGTINWITPRDLAGLNLPVVLDTERRITPDGLAQISSGLLPEGTVLLSSRAPIGYLAITEIPLAINQGFIAMVCDKALPNYYVQLWAEASLDDILSRAGGTTFAEISKANFRPIPVLVADARITKVFVELVEPLHMRLIETLRESSTLASLRDILLPKLLSGEIRLRDAEKAVERAGA